MVVELRLIGSSRNTIRARSFLRQIAPPCYSEAKRFGCASAEAPRERAAAFGRRLELRRGCQASLSRRRQCAFFNAFIIAVTENRLISVRKGSLEFSTAGGSRILGT
jgi:hypothetical protein